MSVDIIVGVVLAVNMANQTKLKLDQGSSSTSDTTAAIKAHGDVKVRTGVLWLVGTVCGILAIGGLVAFFVKPDQSKDIWVIIGQSFPAEWPGLSGLSLAVGRPRGIESQSARHRVKRDEINAPRFIASASATLI
jgi:hypothetical protein